mgnify:CR=1 FL=1
MTKATWREITRLTLAQRWQRSFANRAGPDLQEGRQVWFVSYPGGEAHRITNEPTIYDVGLSVGTDPNRFLLVQQKQSTQLVVGAGRRSGPGKAADLHRHEHVERCLCL